jgi:hypothetical protein
MRRLAVLVAFVAVLLVGAVAYGRDEGRQAVAAQQRGMLEVRGAVGRGMLRPALAIYDTSGLLECLTYIRAGKTAALELCFDATGRLIEAVDRRHGETIWSLRWGRSHAPLRVAPRALDKAVNRLIPHARLVGLLP